MTVWRSVQKPLPLVESTFTVVQPRAPALRRWTVTRCVTPGRTWPQSRALRLPGRWSMKNGLAKLFSAGLGLSLTKRRPDCQPA